MQFFGDALVGDDFGGLVDENELDSISRFADSISSLAVRAHVLEFRLGPEFSGVDYQVCLMDEEKTLNSIRQYRREEPFRDLHGSRVWKFFEKWAEGGSSMRRHLPMLWLEYDRPNGVMSSVPGVFVSPKMSDDGEPINALCQALEVLYSRDDAALKRKIISHVISALPMGARIKHLGAMPSRHANFMRLAIEGFVDSPLSLLSNLDWRGNCDFVARLLARVQERTGMVPTLVDFDYRGEIEDNLGLEFFLVGDQVPDDKGRALIAFLQEQGWCTPRKAKALNSLLEWRITAPKDRSVTALWSKLYHVKIVLKQTRGDFIALPDVECKAYWGVCAGPGPRMISGLQAAMSGRKR